MWIVIRGLNAYGSCPMPCTYYHALTRCLLPFVRAFHARVIACVFLAHCPAGVPAAAAALTPVHYGAGIAARLCWPDCGRTWRWITFPAPFPTLHPGRIHPAPPPCMVLPNSPDVATTLTRGRTFFLYSLYTRWRTRPGLFVSTGSALYRRGIPFST